MRYLKLTWCRSRVGRTFWSKYKWCQIMHFNNRYGDLKYFWIWLMFSWGPGDFYVSCSIISGLKWPPIEKRKSYKSLPNRKILKSFGMHFFDPRLIKASRKQKRNQSRISVYSIKGNISTWLLRLQPSFHAFKLNSST